MNTGKEVEQIAEQYGIDLRNLKGSGKNGEILISDIEEYVKEKYLPKVRKEVKISGIRKVIAERLTKSYMEAVHVTENMEVKMGKFAKTRDELSKKLQTKPSFTVLMLKCIAKALRDFIDLNASIQEDKIIIYDTININLAVESPLGLITPVIRDVDRKRLEQLLVDYRDIIERSQKNELKEKDFIGGTFTVTNLGMYNVDFFNPIINPPQVSILGLNRIVEKPVVEGTQVKIDKVMTLSLTFDHRVIDGALAAKFLDRIRYYLENPEKILVIQEEVKNI
jgi:pyruvate dehydrogenase E2 component (dihydrolipoamide acetyltransferase)|uniref:2-oxo acid dehydrogenase subunit E2 n=1 Tax=Fervidicoccus fontis TaxID=683846 RepID=A0A7J3SKJ6_9CREN